MTAPRPGSWPPASPPAGGHQVGALAVIVLGRVDAAGDRQMVHLLGRHRQQFADVDAGDRGRDRPERPAGGRARLRVPAFQLAQPAVHVEDDDAALFRLPGPRPGAGTGERAEPGDDAAGRGPEEICAGASGARRTRRNKCIAWRSPSKAGGAIRHPFGQWLKRNSAEASRAQASSPAAAGVGPPRRARQSATSATSSGVGGRFRTLR